MVTWLSADIQAGVEPPPIPLIKLELDDERTIYIIKVKMRRNISLAASKTYNINMNTLDDGQPEEFLSLLKNFNNATDGTGATNSSGRINYLHMMLRGHSLKVFDELHSKYGSSTNNHLKLIQEGLIEYFFPISLLLKQKRAMRCVMLKPRRMTFKSFAARLTETNNFLPLFPGLDNSKKMEIEELNKILLHAVPNVQAKKSYLQGWDFELNTYRETCAMLDLVEVTEQVYKGGSPSKTPTREDTTVMVTSGNEMEEKLPRLLTPRRVTLVSTRPKVQAIQAMRPSEKKRHA